ncbi:MAG: hypothetical protein KDB05_32015 [Planctomycetales bacterium]|nr:hypothetical protein [Planctomycetales bacterium]
MASRAFWWELAQNVCVGIVLLGSWGIVVGSIGWDEADVRYYGDQAREESRQLYIRGMQILSGVVVLFCTIAIVCWRKRRKAELEDWRECLPYDETEH